MIRTQTEMFAQRMRLTLNTLTQQVDLLERWNEDDNQDEIMLKAEEQLLNCINDTLDEMKKLQSYEWSALYEAEQKVLKAKQFQLQTEDTVERVNFEEAE